MDKLYDNGVQIVKEMHQFTIRYRKVTFYMLDLY